MYSMELKGKTKSTVSIIDADQIHISELGEYECVVIYDCTLPIESYVQILTNMARYTVNGVLHSLFTAEDSTCRTLDQDIVTLKYFSFLTCQFSQ